MLNENMSFERPHATSYVLAFAVFALSSIERYSIFMYELLNVLDLNV